MAKVNWRKIRRNSLEATGVVLLAFLLSQMLIQPFSFSATTLLSPADRSDFKVTDFYNMVADSRSVSELDTNIVIVNLDRCDRSDIAAILEALAFVKPRAVGLDVMFTAPRDEEVDSRLVEAVNNCPGIIAAATVAGGDDGSGFDLAGTSFFISETPEAMPGIVNLPSKYEKSLIREFRPVFSTDAGNIDGFAAAVVKRADPGAYVRMMERGEELVTINYPSRRFRTLEPEEVFENLDMLDGKIVMLGALNEHSDEHLTPMGGSMSGIEIHTHAVATVINGCYFTVLGTFYNNLIALTLCFIVAFMSLSFDPGVKGGLLRLMQMVMLYALIRVGYFMFISHRVVMDFSLALLMVAFGLFACDIWITVRTIVRAVSSWLGGILAGKNKVNMAGDTSLPQNSQHHT